MTAVVGSSAPGKVVLSGEYAVLEGAAAISMAINRRASVRMVAIEGDVSQVVAPGYSNVEGCFRVTAAGIEWLQGKQEYALFDSVWRAADRAAIGGKTANARRITLDSREFVDAGTGSKTGVGSSAALTAALAVAFAAEDEIEVCAHRAHADLQGGAGSGVDIATSLCGGLIEYQMSGPYSARLTWPSGLLFRVLWTGVSASTTQRLALLKQVAVKPSRARFVAAASLMAAAWRTADAAAILAQYKHYIEALRQFSIEHGLGIFDAGHDEIADAARAANLVYKPCGAGGGDVGIVLATDEAALQAFVARQTAAHKQYKVLDCVLDDRGAGFEDSLAGPAVSAPAWKAQ